MHEALLFEGMCTIGTALLMLLIRILNDNVDTNQTETTTKYKSQGLRPREVSWCSYSKEGKGKESQRR